MLETATQGRHKAIVAAIAVGLGVGLIGRRLLRRRARRLSKKSFQTVAFFSVTPLIHEEDADWETLPGRALFKRLCTALTMAGYPASDVGDIDAAHCCEVVAGGAPLFVTLTSSPDNGARWVLSVSGQRPKKGRHPAPPPADTFETRAFLGTLGRTLRDLVGVDEISWRSA